MKIFDKAQWHIDAGEDAEVVVGKFRSVYAFLEKNKLLSEDGKELLEFGIDSSISLNEQMVTEAGGVFLDKFYDEVINYGKDLIVDELEKRYAAFNVDDNAKY